MKFRGILGEGPIYLVGTPKNEMTADLRRLVKKCGDALNTLVCTRGKEVTKKQKQEALLSQRGRVLSQRGRAMLRVCTSIQNVERSLLLLVVSASDIQLRRIKLFSVLCSSAYSIPTG